MNDWTNVGDVNHQDYGGLFIKQNRELGPNVHDWIRTENMEDALGRDVENWKAEGGKDHMFTGGTIYLDEYSDEDLRDALSVFGMQDANLDEVDILTFIEALLAYGMEQDFYPHHVSAEEYDEVLNNWMTRE